MILFDRLAARPPMGSIGWQCKHYQDWQTHAFDDTSWNSSMVRLLSPRLRRAMPIIRYCTGDGE
jgi:hypothetical protein